MADIKKLISQLRKQVPAVNQNPILDEIESAYDDEESNEDTGAEGGDSQPGPDDEATDPEDQADGGADEATEDESDDYAAPAPKSKAGKSRPMPKMSKTNPFM